MTRDQILRVLEEIDDRLWHVELGAVERREYSTEELASNVRRLIDIVKEMA
jgi:hypothetical protein